MKMVTFWRIARSNISDYEKLRWCQSASIQRFFLVAVAAKQRGTDMKNYSRIIQTIASM